MRVKRLRLQRGWSQRHLAEVSGLSVRTIQRIEGSENPGFETAKSLAAVFEVDLQCFLAITPEPDTASAGESSADSLNGRSVADISPGPGTACADESTVASQKELLVRKKNWIQATEWSRGAMALSIGFVIAFALSISFSQYQNSKQMAATILDLRTEIAQVNAELKRFDASLQSVIAGDVGESELEVAAAPTKQAASRV